MHALLLSPALVLTSLVATLQAPEPTRPAPTSIAVSPSELFATGTFTQTGITDIQVKNVGPLTIIDQTSFGTVSGTLSGSFEDELRVVILPNGTFTARFTLTVDCTIDGEHGILTLEATDVGQIVGPDTAEFSGVAAITNATGGLQGIHGVLEIDGTVDLQTGLSTYSYAGTLHTTP